MPFLMFESLANENCLRGREHGRKRSPSRAEARLRYLDIARTRDRAYAQARTQTYAKSSSITLESSFWMRVASSLLDP